MQSLTGKKKKKTERAARQIEFVWRKVQDMVEGHEEEVKPGMDRRMRGVNFSCHVKERYVTTDCLHTQLWLGSGGGGSPHLQTEHSHKHVLAGNITEIIRT